MERVPTLLKKLQRQFEENQSALAMLTTVQFLHAELINLCDKKTAFQHERVSILMPLAFAIPPASGEGRKVENEEEKVVEVLQVDEKEIEEELEQIKRKAASVHATGSLHPSAFVYDPIEDIPTLSHQDAVPHQPSAKSERHFEYPESLNDRLKESRIELSQSLTTTPIKDLKKAIGVNDRFLFINELFRGDEAMYERSIKTIQNFSIFAEAEFWIRRELKLKLAWNDLDPVVKQFDQLVKRRFG